MIPLSTTTIAVLRTAPGDVYADPYETPPTRTTVASGVRAVISGPSGTDQVVGGEQAVTALSLVADPCDVDYADLVKDETSNIVYRLTWVFAYPTHVEGRLERVQGEV